jgi:vancomycin resistance protein YoaR
MVALVGGAALFMIIMILLVIAFGWSHAGQIYPGVVVGGVDLSGMSQKQAELVLANRLVYPQSGKLVFQSGQQVWIAAPSEIGLALDARSSAAAAFNLGRSGDPVSRLFNRFIAWYSGKNLPPLMVYDERLAHNYLGRIAAQIDRPTIEASLQINGAQVVASPGQVGRRLDIPSTLYPLSGQLRNMTDGILPLVVVETPPEIADASQQAEIARQMLSAPLTLSIPDAQDGDPGPWTIEPQKLGEMLAFEKVQGEQGAQYQVVLKQVALRQFLQEQAPRLARGPANARFIFNDETRKLEVIQPAVIGRELDVQASLQTINDKLVQGEHNIPLTLIYTPPAVGNDATAEQLGITEQVVSYSSYFRGSSASRIQNIETAAARFHGLLIPPGATFSMADAMGDVSLDSGYAEALIIYGGRTIKGVGGGVCQVSTTLFRSVFFAGFPVVERYPHAYRVGYYEQTPNGYDASLAGLDATVFVPVVDFKFVNDTPYWLLMETYVNPKAGRLTWKFYSTKDGRNVEWNTSGPQNIVSPPPPKYEENPDLGQGEIKQVDWAAEGADVLVTRTVYRDGQVLFSDQFATHYEPWQDIFQYGPGTDIPKN